MYQECGVLTYHSGRMRKYRIICTEHVVFHFSKLYGAIGGQWFIVETVDGSGSVCQMDCFFVA